MIKQLPDRINNELGLRFTSTKNATIINGVGCDSFSFCIIKLADSGTIISKPANALLSSDINCSVNNLTFVLINADSKIFINGAENGSHTLDWSAIADITINGQAGGEDFIMSNLILYNKTFTNAEAKALWQQVGSPNKTNHASIVGHYPLTQKYYFKADGAFIAKHPQLSVGDIVALDVVEQYNYARAEQLDSDFTTWTLGDASFSSTTTTISYNGTAGGLRTSFKLITNVSTSRFIKVRFNVSALTGSGFFIFYGTTSTEVSRILINSTGIKEIILENGLNTPNLIIGNGNGYGTTYISSTWTIEDIELIPLNNNHGKLVNYTDAEVGAVEPATQTVVFDTKTKLRASHWGLKFTGLGSDQVAFNAALTTPPNLGNYNNSFFAEFTVLSADGNQRFIFDVFDPSNINNPAFRLQFVSSGAGFVLLIYLHSTFTQFHRITFNDGADLILGKKYKITCEFLDEDLNNAIIRINNKVINITNQSAVLASTVNDMIINSLSLGNIRDQSGTLDAECIIYDIQFNNALLTYQEREDLFKLNKPAASIIERIIPEKRSDNQINTLLGNQLLLTNFTLSEFNDYYKEVKSGLPEIRQAYNFIRANNHFITIPNFNPTKENGYTYIVAYAKNADDNFLAGTEGMVYKGGTGVAFKTIIGNAATKSVSLTDSVGSSVIADFKKNDSINWFIGQEKQDYFVSGNDKVCFANGNLTGLVSASINGWDEVLDNNPLIIGRRNNPANGLDSNLLFVGIWKGILSNKEITKIVNNTLGSNDLKSDCELYLLFNSEQMSEDGSFVYVKDHSPQNRVCTWNGLSGATSVDKLADLLTNIVDINSLR